MVCCCDAMVMETNMDRPETDSVNGNDGLAEKSEKRTKPRQDYIIRRSFLCKSLAVGAGTMAAGMLAETAKASSGITDGDIAILRWLAVAEIIETDMWQQYNELGGIQDSEVPGGSGNEAYTEAMRPILTPNAGAMHALHAFSGSGIFSGQSQTFLSMLSNLASAADAAQGGL